MLIRLRRGIFRPDAVPGSPSATRGPGIGLGYRRGSAGNRRPRRPGAAGARPGRRRNRGPPRARRKPTRPSCSPARTRRRLWPMAPRRWPRNPETLSAELQVLFREQGLETLLGSVAEAMRKYQSADAAQELVALAAESGADRDRLQQYVVNLAARARERVPGDGPGSAALPRPGTGPGHPGKEEEIGRLCPFQCSICGEESTRICVRCTKDACDNHLCEKCRKCSDCCDAKWRSRRTFPSRCGRPCTRAETAPSAGGSASSQVGPPRGRAGTAAPSHVAADAAEPVASSPGSAAEASSG